MGLRSSVVALHVRIFFLHVKQYCKEPQAIIVD